jgi:hypothetical protein
MNDLNNNIERIKQFPKNNLILLKKIMLSLKAIIDGKREIMYSDLINLIIRKGYRGEDYNQLLLWCNYKIRIGEIFIELE